MRFIDYPLVMTNIVIEHGPVEIVDLPIKQWWIFPQLCQYLSTKHLGVFYGVEGWDSLTKSRLTTIVGVWLKPAYQRRFTWKSNKELSINGSCQFIPICWVSDLLLSHFACCQFLFRFMSHVFNVCGTPSIHVSSFFLPPFILDP